MLYWLAGSCPVLSVEKVFDFWQGQAAAYSPQTPDTQSNLPGKCDCMPLLVRRHWCADMCTQVCSTKSDVNITTKAVAVSFLVWKMQCCGKCRQSSNLHWIETATACFICVFNLSISGVTSSPILEKEDLGYVTGSLVYALGQVIGYPVKVGAIPLQYTATSPKLTGMLWLG